MAEKSASSASRPPAASRGLRRISARNSRRSARLEEQLPQLQDAPAQQQAQQAPPAHRGISDDFRLAVSRALILELTVPQRNVTSSEAELRRWRHDVHYAFDVPTVARLFVQFLDSLKSTMALEDEASEAFEEAKLQLRRGPLALHRGAVVEAVLVQHIGACYDAYCDDAAIQRQRKQLKRKRERRAKECLSIRQAFHRDVLRDDRSKHRTDMFQMGWCRDPDNPTFVVLDGGPQLQRSQLLELREEGVAPTSSTSIVARERGLLPMRTDAYAPPPVGITCTLAAFFSVLGMCAAPLGLAADPLVRLNNPLGFCALSLLLLRNWASPAGAMTLLRVDVAHWEVIRMLAGLFIFVGYLRKHDTFHLHAMAYNAGSGVLYLVPYVVLVTEEDKQHLDLFAARMQLEYGIYLSRAEPFRCRQIYINPMHRSAPLLGYNEPSALGGGLSKSAKRRRSSARPRKRCKKGARDE